MGRMYLHCGMAELARQTFGPLTDEPGTTMFNHALASMQCFDFEAARRGFKACKDDLERRFLRDRPLHGVQRLRCGGGGEGGHVMIKTLEYPETPLGRD